VQYALRTQAIVPCAPPVSGNRSPDAIEVQVRRYAAKLRRRLRRQSEASPRYTDLLFSFPAACVALVTKRGSPLAQAEAMHLVRSGAPLAEVASALQLPM